jgi:tetratricopeptide (TPR) repeat protein
VVATFRTELGVAPGPAVTTAMREPVHAADEIADGPTVQAIVEAGSAAVAAGAVESGVQSLRTAVRLADRVRDARLRVSARLRLAEALIHSIGGLDEVGLAALFEADQIASDHGDTEGMSSARAELGYVDFLRGRYDRAEVWLNDALAVADVSVATRVKAMTYLGTVASDRADYAEAAVLLDEAIELARTAGAPRREAWAMSMLGRISLFHGELDAASAQLDASITLAERDHWLAFLPWPQALRGEVLLAYGDRVEASAILQQAFARACQIGDPCWEGMAARGLALTAEAEGDTDRAFSILADARRRACRLADPYVWLDGYILDAQCGLGRRYGHPDVASWVESLRALASRTGMKEFAHRSLIHGAALGNVADAELLAAA